MARFDLTAAAVSDISSISSFTAEQWGDNQADAYLGAMELRLTQLAAHPLLGHRREELASGVLSFPFESHIIYYTPVRTGILVLRILHARQDPYRHVG